MSVIQFNAPSAKQLSRKPQLWWALFASKVKERAKIVCTPMALPRLALNILADSLTNRGGTLKATFRVCMMKLENWITCIEVVVKNRASRFSFSARIRISDASVRAWPSQVWSLACRCPGVFAELGVAFASLKFLPGDFASIIPCQNRAYLAKGVILFTQESGAFRDRSWRGRVQDLWIQRLSPGHRL